MMMPLALVAKEQYSEADAYPGDNSGGLLSVEPASQTVPSGDFSLQPASQSGVSDMLDGFVSAILGKRVSFDYSYTLSASTGSKITGSGHVVFQGDSFMQEGNGLETYCDGRSRWTLDRSAKEAIAESVDSSSPDYLSYPTFILRDIDKVFAPDGGQSVSEKKISGQDAVSLKLRPAVPMGKISSALLYFAKGTYRPVALDLYLEDGSVLKLSVSGYEVSSPVEDNMFSLDAWSLGDEYVITDLR